jgi:predicted protein tyrosine phosphatase
MIIPALGRHLSVQSRQNAEATTRQEPGFWNVISISQPKYHRAELRGAKSVLFLIFDDVCDPSVVEPGAWTLFDARHWAQVKEYVGKTRQEPLLIHCVEGRSRSAALALTLLLLAAGPEVTDDGLREIWAELKQLRPIAEPNAHVVKTAIGVEWGPEAAESIHARLTQVVMEAI